MRDFVIFEGRSENKFSAPDKVTWQYYALFQRHYGDIS